MLATTIIGQNHCALHKFHARDSQDTCDQITMECDRKSKRAWWYCLLCIPFILSGGANEGWLHTCDACVISTWRLGSSPAKSLVSILVIWKSSKNIMNNFLKVLFSHVLFQSKDSWPYNRCAGVYVHPMAWQQQCLRTPKPTCERS